MSRIPVPPSSIGPHDETTEASRLELRQVSAGYGPYRALFDVSLEVPVGAIVALLGSNGAGKSTLARVASGLIRPTAGRIRVGGLDVTDQPAHRIARLGVAHLPEGRAIFSSLSVEENLVLSFRARAGRREIVGALASAYETYPVLADRRAQRAGTLSGGQQRLLSLAKVLTLPPKLLIADEMSLGLAPKVVDDVYQRLRTIGGSDTSLLVIEQQVDRVLELADRAVVLDHGAVVYDGAPEAATEALASTLADRNHGNSRTIGAARRMQVVQRR
jgi:branched-chain amino acid transport system ATP-binding protein